MFDWNNDGKTDYKDDYIYHEVFDTKKSDDDSDDFTNSGSFYPSGTSRGQQSPQRQQQQSRQTDGAGILGNKFIIAMVVFIVLKLLLGD